MRENRKEKKKVISIQTNFKLFKKFGKKNSLCLDVVR